MPPTGRQDGLLGLRAFLGAVHAVLAVCQRVFCFVSLVEIFLRSNGRVG